MFPIFLIRHCILYYITARAFASNARCCLSMACVVPFGVSTTSNERCGFNASFGEGGGKRLIWVRWKVEDEPLLSEFQNLRPAFRHTRHPVGRVPLSVLRRPFGNF